MGQDVSCCQQVSQKPIFDPQIGAVRNVKQPQQSGDILRTFDYQSRLLQSNSLQQVYHCTKVSVPTKSPVVLKALEKLSSMKLPQTYQRGAFRPDYYRIDSTGIIYNGQWKDNIPHGIGQYYYPNKSYFQGTFIQGVPHGYGRFINSDGNQYEGDIKFGRSNGKGKYSSKQLIYEGEFKDNQKHGLGVQITSKSHFQGQFQYDQKIKGVLKYGKFTYIGSFYNNTFNGKGKLITQTGEYEGNFMDGLQHGFGQFKWHDGSYYRGNFKQGIREGDGQYFNHKNGTLSKGFWKNGVLNGNGEYVDHLGKKHKCIWSNNKISSIL